MKEISGVIETSWEVTSDRKVKENLYEIPMIFPIILLSFFIQQESVSIA